MWIPVECRGFTESWCSRLTVIGRSEQWVRFLDLFFFFLIVNFLGEAFKLRAELVFAGRGGCFSSVRIATAGTPLHVEFTADNALWNMAFLDVVVPAFISIRKDVLGLSRQDQFVIQKQRSNIRPSTSAVLLLKRALSRTSKSQKLVFRSTVWLLRDVEERKEFLLHNCFEV